MEIQFLRTTGVNLASDSNQEILGAKELSLDLQQVTRDLEKRSFDATLHKVPSVTFLQYMLSQWH
jgi:hypothetical protein